MTARRIRLGLTVDDRTDTMHDEALYCRAYGHRWNVRPFSEARLRETLQQGVIEDVKWCDNGCGCEWTQIIDARSFEVVSSSRRYGEGYLLKPNSGGRLARSEARKSKFVRQFPQFV